MKGEVLIDTDILSYYFKGDSNVVARLNNYLEDFDLVNISIITYYEINAGLSYKNATKQLNDFEKFASQNNIIHLSEKSAKRSAKIYAQLRQQGITIGSSDVLIAGIAIENGLTLVTNNIKHYGPIDVLRIVNWKKP